MNTGKLHDYIKSKGIRQTVIARYVGTDNTSMSLYLRGLRQMPADVFLGICLFLEVDPRIFADDTHAET